MVSIKIYLDIFLCLTFARILIKHVVNLCIIF